MPKRKLTKREKLREAHDNSDKGPDPYSPYMNGYRDGLRYALSLFETESQQRTRPKHHAAS